MRCPIKIVLLLITLLTLPARAADPDLSPAASPLISFANWCAANKAKSPGLAALDLAKKFSPPQPDLDAAAKLLDPAPDDNANAPTVTQKKLAACEAAAAELDRLPTRYPKADELTLESWQIQAIELSPAPRASRLLGLMDKAAKANRLDSLERLYLLALSLDDTAKQPFKSAEAAFLKNNSLPTVAEHAVPYLLDRKHGDLAAALLIRLASLDPTNFSSGKYQPAIDALSKSAFLVQAKSHAMVALVSIPPKWDPTKKSPILLCYEGAGSNFRGLHDAFKSAAAEGPWIIVTPITFSNTNQLAPEKFDPYYSPAIQKPFLGPQANYAQRMQFDQPGSLAILKLVHDNFNTETSIYVTGFSGGGNPAYTILATVPDIVAAGAPACANFFAASAPSGKSKAAPIQQFFGEKDDFNQKIANGPGLLAQGAAAATMLTTTGYKVLPKIMVPDTGHSAMPAQVLTFFNETRKKQNP